MDDGTSNANTVHKFAISKWYRLVFGAVGFLFCLIGLIVPLAAFGVIMPPPVGVSPEIEMLAKVASIIAFCGAFVAGFYQFWTVGNIQKKTICLDESGIWYEHIGKKQGLIRWQQVANAKDRGNQSQLDLLNLIGTVLISIPLFIQDFSTLRELVLSKIRLDKSILSLPITFGSMRRSIWTAAASLSFIVALAVGGLFIPAPQGKPAWMMPLISTGILLVLVPVVTWDYFRRAQEILVKKGEIHLSYFGSS